MKTIFMLSIFLFVLVLPAFCQTPQNTVETDIAVIKTEIKNLREAMNKGFENINKRFENINKRFESVDERFESVDERFDTVQKNFDRQNNIIIACIGIPWAILALGATVWGILAHRRSRKNHILKKQIETLTQAIEMLKRQRIVQP